MTIEQRPNGTYRVKIRMKGPDGVFVNPPDKTFQLKKDAQRYKTQTQAQIRAGYFQSPVQVSWADYIAPYIADYARRSKVRSKDVKVRKSHLNRWLGEIGPKYITSITDADLLRVQARFQEQRSKKTGAPLANSSINKMIFAMQNFLDWAFRRQLVSHAPKIRQLSQGQGRIRYLLPDEKDRFESVIEQISDPALKAFMFMAYFTGARAGELLNLTWARLDFSTQTVLFVETKNDLGRRVPLQACWKVIEAYAKATGARGNNEHVFLNQRGSMPYNYAPLWAKIREKAELEDFVFHDLRHNAASQLVMRGIDIVRVKEFMGHKTIQMTMNYAHLNPEVNLATGQALGEALFGGSEKH